MNAPGDPTLHGLTTFAVDDLTFTVTTSPRRSTLEVIVDRDASLILKGPVAATVASARAFVLSKRSWIYRRLAEKDALGGPATVKSFVDGEGFAYLGRSYRLKLDPTADAVRLDHGRFVMPSALAAEGYEAMRCWYIATGQPWLAQRVTRWAARAGFDSVAVDVRDLGFRWGSARPGLAEARINIHWATVQLPPSLIDYVLVHEIAHLIEANHTPEYWAIVGRLMPGFEGHKQTLASIGRSVWLGATAP